MEKDFLNIVDNHQGIIHKVCKMYRDSREDQEDLFQEIVLQLWKAYPKFRKESKVSTWMYRISLNTAIAIFRKNRVSVDYRADLGIEAAPTGKMAASENEERMFEAFRKLDKAERAIVALYLEGYSHREIGTVIGITENYVGVKIKRIKDKLKEILN